MRRRGGTGLKGRQERAAAYAATVRPIIIDLRSRGLSLRGICAELTRQGVQTPKGGKWAPEMVARILDPP